MLVIVALLVALAGGQLNLTQQQKKVFDFYKQIIEQTPRILQAKSISALFLFTPKWNIELPLAINALGEAYRVSDSITKMGLEFTAEKVVDIQAHLYNLVDHVHLKTVQANDIKEMLRFVEFVFNFKTATDKNKLFTTTKGYRNPIDLLKKLQSICLKLRTKEAENLGLRIGEELLFFKETRDHEQVKNYMIRLLNAPPSPTREEVKKALERKLSDVPTLCTSVKTLEKVAHLYEIAAWLNEWKAPRLTLKDMGARSPRLYERLPAEVTYVEKAVSSMFQGAHYSQDKSAMSLFCSEEKIKVLMDNVQSLSTKSLTKKFLVLWVIRSRIKNYVENKSKHFHEVGPLLASERSETIILPDKSAENQGDMKSSPTAKQMNQPAEQKSSSQTNNDVCQKSESVLLLHSIQQVWKFIKTLDFTKIFPHAVLNSDGLDESHGLRHLEFLEGSVFVNKISQVSEVRNSPIFQVIGNIAHILWLVDVTSSEQTVLVWEVTGSCTDNFINDQTKKLTDVFNFLQHQLSLVFPLGQH